MIFGTVAATASYTPYGAPLSAGGATAATPFGFSGEYTDPSGLVYLRARYYDPATGQFLSVDPLVDDTRAPYGYAAGDPLDTTDPTGLCNGNPLSGSFWTKGNCLSDNAQYVPGGSRVKSFASCAGAGGTSVYDCGVMNFDPAYAAVEGYANEWADAQNPCSSNWTLAKDALEAVQGVAGTATLAVTGASLASVAADTAGVGADNVVNGLRLRAQLTGDEIAGGHAFDKHIGEFPGITTREEFARTIEDTVMNGEIRPLSNGRTAYWYDGTVVIRNPAAADGGTAFRPTDGYDYFLGLH